LAYKALYRTYRPTRFEDVVGQKHVIKILKNACMTDRISHAYVFSGLRGIGKTTIARIFAKAVNCELSKDGEPCNICKNCLSIINDETTDVIELDAASNNGVDQMRDILEKVNFLPSSLKKKVYIIDEAHMLSTAAFNALLKTLEEPPSHVIFILATTEPYKLPSTILSRCQRLDFKQLSVHEIVEMLSKVITKENIKITDDALLAIALASEGGMRDALSILDQARVYESNQITIDGINSLTGRISQSYLASLLQAIDEADTQKAIDCISNLIENGKDVSRILTCLIQFCRDLLLYKSLKDDESISYIYNKEEFSSLASELNEKKLFYYVDSFVDIQNKIRYTNSQKLYLEVGIIKLINNANTDIDLLTKITHLEERINLMDPSDNLDSVKSLLNRIDYIENKVKKAQAELEKANIQGFKDNILSKISLLEDLTLATKSAPEKLEEKIQDLEERIIELKTLSQVTNDSSVEAIQKEENPADILNIDEKIASLEEKLKNIHLTDTTKQLEKIDEIEKQLQELSLEIASIKGLSLDENLKQIQDRIATIEASANQPALPEANSQASYDDKELKERIEIVEEYLDMVIAKVDELSRGIRQTTNTDQSSKEEIEQLNENYMVLLNHIRSLQEKLELNEPATQIIQETASPVEIEHSNNVTKEEILELTNQMIEELKGLINSNYNELNSKILSVDQGATIKINELHQTLDTDLGSSSAALNERLTEIIQQVNAKFNELDIKEPVDFTPLIEANKQSIVDIKDYTIKLSAKIQEIQNKVLEINTKLDGGLTKRRSPFEINREEEKTEPQVVLAAPKEEAPATTTKIYEEETKHVKSSPTTVVIKTKPQAPDNDNTNNVYDIKIVERILNQAHSQACREEKIRLLSMWPRLEDKVGHLLAPTAKLLSEGILTANGEKELLIVFPHASMCNHLMEPKGHTNALQIIKIAFGKDYDFIALPENTWQEKRSEYAGQFHIGIKYPRLSPINNPELKINTVNTNNLFSKKNASMYQAQSLFGSELVEKEEDE